MAEPEVYASLDPEDAVKVKGLADDFDGTIFTMRAVLWTYPNQTEIPEACFAMARIIPDGAEYASNPFDAEGRFVGIEEVYKIGPLEVIEPKMDGTRVGPAGDKTEVYISLDSAFNFFNLNAKSAGFTSAKLKSGDFTAFDGQRFHFKRVVKKGSGKAKDSAPLVPTKYLGTGSAAATPTKGSGSSAAPAATPDNVDEQAQGLLVTILAEAEGASIPKSKLSAFINKAAKAQGLDAQTTTKVTVRGLSDKFLKAGAESGLWSFNGTQVGPAASE